MLSNISSSSKLSKDLKWLALYIVFKFKRRDINQVGAKSSCEVLMEKR